MEKNSGRKNSKSGGVPKGEGLKLGMWVYEYALELHARAEGLELTGDDEISGGSRALTSSHDGWDFSRFPRCGARGGEMLLGKLGGEVVLHPSYLAGAGMWRRSRDLKLQLGQQWRWVFFLLLLMGEDMEKWGRH
jgi:hypothetical protein